MRRGFYSKVTVMYHLAPLPQYSRKTHYLVLKTPAKRLYLKMFNISIEENIADLDQTAHTEAVLSGSTLFVYEASNILVDDKLFALRVNKCEFSVYTVRIFMKCTHVWVAQSANLLFAKL